MKVILRRVQESHSQFTAEQKTTLTEKSWLIVSLFQTCGTYQNFLNALIQCYYISICKATSSLMSVSLLTTLSTPLRQRLSKYKTIATLHYANVHVKHLSFLIYLLHSTP